MHAFFDGMWGCDFEWCGLDGFGMMSSPGATGVMFDAVDAMQGNLSALTRGASPEIGGFGAIHRKWALRSPRLGHTADGYQMMAHPAALEVHTLFRSMRDSLQTETAMLAMGAGCREIH